MGETIRVEHSKDYTIISNQAIRDVRLSLRARGLHHLLLSYPNGWKINIDHLTGESKIEGRDAIATALGELEKLGYLTRTQKRVGGKFSGYESVIRELPIRNPPPPKGKRSKKKQESPETAKPETAKPETAKPETAKPETAEPETANPVHIKYLFNEVINQELSREEVSIPPYPRNQNGKWEEGKSQPVEAVESGSALDQIGFPDQSKPESLQQTENLPLGQNSPAPLAKAETTADRVRRTWLETGILPSIPMELEAWVQIDLGSKIVASYRKSGRVTTIKQGDIQPTFASYVASQWKGKDIDYGYSYIRSLEKDPTKWETLAALVIKWQASKSTNNHNLNITQEVERASKPVVDFGGIRL
jgi:hypothetical protein